MVCADCSAEVHTNAGCVNCGPLCATHFKAHKLGIDCKTGETAPQARRQIATRGDFQVDMAVTGAQGEKRFFLCGPDDVNQTGITLANLKAVWHLIGEVIEEYDE